MTTAGKQIDGQTLYERQKQLRAANHAGDAPVIIAVDLQASANIGSVLRLADAAGCAQVIFVGTKEIDHPLMHKIARNAEALVKWQTISHDAFIAHLENYKPMIAIEITTASQSIFEKPLPKACSIVIGSERHGVPADILDSCDFAIHIPMFGINGSMNVTHALAVALWEWRRQHAGLPSPA